MLKHGQELLWCCLVLLVSLLVRFCTMLHPHSGQGAAPMYGDYEAQRHWMEITVNLPMNQWYHNTTDNNLEYWGLDYPPLTAYHSYLCGLIAYMINPKYVALHESRGYETEDHKLFMRLTVIVADLFVYIPAIITYFIIHRNFLKKEHHLPLSSTIFIALLYPGIILIDHGHFQYNCISLGFLIYAVTFLVIKQQIFASIMFCLALNYKQMELYHAFPFFFYILSSCIPNPGEQAFHGILHLSKVALTVLMAFSILWFPFLFEWESFFQVVHRIFPLARGIFEDKVANVWCSLNVIYKFKTFCATQLLHYCTIATLTAALPSICDLFLHPNIHKFVPALINSALAFFLFSFQVHEKSILLAAIPAVLYLPEDPKVTFWFLFITNFSMLPLFVKDNLVIAFIALTVMYSIAFYDCYTEPDNTKTNNSFYLFYKEILNTLIKAQNNKLNYTKIPSILYKYFVQNRTLLKKFALNTFVSLSVLGCFILTLLFLAVEPPMRYPDLFPLAISVYCCVHFVGFFVYFNVVQFNLPQSFDGVKLKHS